MVNKFAINLNADSKLEIGLNSSESFKLQSATPIGGGTKDYSSLTNKPSINGVTLSGDKTSADLNIVSENTAEGWAETPLYVPKVGEICLYSDSAQIKIGDGIVPIVDLPYIGNADLDNIMAALQNHVENTLIHVSDADRLRWDSKLNYISIGENLIFTRE